MTIKGKLILDSVLRKQLEKGFIKNRINNKSNVEMTLSPLEKKNGVITLFGRIRTGICNFKDVFFSIEC